MTYGHEAVHPDSKDNPQFNYHQYGLTKREYFAAMAMQGFLSNTPDWTDSDQCLKWVSESSVKYADALIEALNEKKNKPLN